MSRYRNEAEQFMMEHLSQLDIPIPRYTSYPPANVWKSIEYREYKEALSSLVSNLPLSLYIHIPFCHSMCLYCGCSVVLNRNPKNEEEYVSALLQEIEHIGSLFSSKKAVSQLHFGGGTPTKLSSVLIQKILEKIDLYFLLTDDVEIAIEIDPRTVSQDGYRKLFDLKSMGFNRVSFGVQDTNQDVQEAVKRRQSVENTKETFFQAKQLGFHAINIDLIYGLPLQNRATFRDTIHTISEEMSPDRISLFSYARVPWIKPHQKAISEELLPKTQEKLLMYLDARDTLVEKGYVAIGMDHFAKASDPLAHAFIAREVKRNFQGYTVSSAQSMIGFGMSAISDLPDGYFQNSKTIEGYYRAIHGKQEGGTERGYKLSLEDHMRRHIIHELMCHFSIDIDLLELRWHISFFDYFSHSLKLLQWFIDHKCVEISEDKKKIIVTGLGEWCIRNIASCFDSTHRSLQQQLHYSRAI